MTKIRVVGLAAFAVSVATGIIALVPSLSASQQGDWHVVVALNAYVSHGLSTTFSPATKDEAIHTGDRLTTRAGGTLVLLRGADIITLAENTQIAITDPQPKQSTLIEQPYGEAQYQVEHKSAPHFEVDTPLLATVVKGTTFTIRSTATVSSISVKNGKVEAIDRRSGAQSSVSTGQTGTVANSAKSVSVSSTPVGAGATPPPAQTPAAAPAPAGPAPGPKPKPGAPANAPAGPAAGPARNGPAGPAGGGPAGGRPAGGGGPAGGGPAGGGPAGGGPSGGGPAGGGPAGGGPGGGGPGKPK